MLWFLLLVEALRANDLRRKEFLLYDTTGFSHISTALYDYNKRRWARLNVIVRFQNRVYLAPCVQDFLSLNSYGKVCTTEIILSMKETMMTVHGEMMMTVHGTTTTQGMRSVGMEKIEHIFWPILNGVLWFFNNFLRLRRQSLSYHTVDRITILLFIDLAS